MPRAKVNKVLAYRKCQQCRKDRQKCSPEARPWPGRQCDRCQRYGYACSANRTKDEETAPSNLGDFTRQDAESEARVTSFSPEPRSLPQGDAQSEARMTSFSPEPRSLAQGDAEYEARMTSFSPEPRSLPQGDAEYEARCLQDLGDCHRTLKFGEKFRFLRSYYVFKEYTIRERIDGCVKRITVQAQVYQTQGRYKDAEYLYRQLEAASALRGPCDDSSLKPELDLVLIYEKLGNLPAAEIHQERRLLLLPSRAHGLQHAVISQEAENLFRLYTFFLTRVENQNVMATQMVLLMVFYRIAVLDCSMLNALLFQSALWRRCKPDLCLEIAIRIQSTEMLCGLISIGVDINQCSRGWGPPLLTAAQYGDLKGLELLLENKANVIAKSANSKTALHHAMLRDGKQRDETCDIIRCLIKAGVDIEAEDWHKDTALNIAVRLGYLTTVRSLLQQGANIERHRILGETPLFCALRYGDVSMVELFLDHGANIESRSSNRNTPLHEAVIYGQVEMVRMLLGRGASTATYNNVGQTPVDIASSKGNQILVDILYLRLIRE